MTMSYRIRSILVEDEVKFRIEEKNSEYWVARWEPLNSWYVYEGGTFGELEYAEKHLLSFIAATETCRAPPVYYDHEGIRK